MVTFFCFVFRSRFWAVPYPALTLDCCGHHFAHTQWSFRLGFDGTNRMLALTWGAFW